MIKKLLAKIIYLTLVDAAVSFALAISSQIMSGPIDWGMLWINFGVAISISIIIGMCLPLTSIGKKFTALFKVKTDTYENNISYRLLSTAAISFTYFIILNPALCVLNVWIYHKVDFGTYMISFAINVIPLFLVGFLTSLVADYPVFHICRKIDHTM